MKRLILGLLIGVMFLCSSAYAIDIPVPDLEVNRFYSLVSHEGYWGGTSRLYEFTYTNLRVGIFDRDGDTFYTGSLSVELDDSLWWGKLNTSIGVYLGYCPEEREYDNGFTLTLIGMEF